MDTKPELKEAPAKGSRSFVVGALLFLGLLVGGGFYVTHAQKAKIEQGAGPGGGRHHVAGAVSVGVATARQGDVAVVLTALGTVTPRQSVTVRTQISGILTSIGFTEGQMVKAGDFLAQIDARPYENALAKAEGALQKDQALLKDAETKLARYKILAGKESLAKQDLDTQASLADQYRGNVATDQADIDAAKLNLTYCHITAPLAGRVGLRQVDPGNYVQTSDTNGLVTLAEVQPITVLFAVPEDRVPVLLARMKEGTPIAVEALDRAQKNVLATGTMTAMDNQVNTSTGTIKLRALFDNTDGALFPNQFVNVRLTVEQQKNVVLVPVAAIQQGQKGSFVYGVDADHKVVVRLVKTGVTQGDFIAIQEGLSVGDQVVIDGVDQLQEGTSVSVVAQP